MQTRIAKLIAAVAIIVWVLGGIVGIAMGAQYTSFTDTFDFLSMLLYWVLFFIIGTLYYGFAMLVDQVICLRDETSQSLSGIFTVVTRIAAVMEARAQKTQPQPVSPAPVYHPYAASSGAPRPTAPVQPFVAAEPPCRMDDESALEDTPKPKADSPVSPKSTEPDKIFCPNCGKPQAADRKSCLHCGAIFSEDLTPDAASLASKAMPAVSGAIFCPSCGKQQSEIRDTCYWCGGELIH